LRGIDDMRFFLIRHGRTNWNSEGRYQGVIDVPLDEVGKKQAELLAKSLKCVTIDKVWSSPLSRAKETAWYISQEQGCPLEVHEGLTEISHGEWEGKYAHEVKVLWPDLYDLWYKEPQKVKMPSGETLEEVANRAKGALEFILGEGKDPVAVVTHDAVIKVLLCHFLELPLAKFWSFHVANCSVTMIERKGKEFCIYLLGERPWASNRYDWEKQAGL
jgi:probable phosphoglycerate mutase